MIRSMKHATTLARSPSRTKPMAKSRCFPLNNLRKRHFKLCQRLQKKEPNQLSAKKEVDILNRYAAKTKNPLTKSANITQ
jgi:hypothetical protein